MEEYQCCICKETVSNESSSSFLDPCALVLVSNIDKARESHKEQQFFCHLECFRKLVDEDGIMYIMDENFPTVGEVDGDEGSWNDEGLN